MLCHGAQGKGTRFLTYVDAVKGFGHLLTQSYLDQAAAMCPSLNGSLRSKFIVLDDDRVLPAPPSAHGKRGLEFTP